MRLIDMDVVEEPDVDYESNWAMLTFDVRAPAAGSGGWPCSAGVVGSGDSVLTQDRRRRASGSVGSGRAVCRLGEARCPSA